MVSRVSSRLPGIPYKLQTNHHCSATVIAVPIPSSLHRLNLGPHINVSSFGCILACLFSNKSTVSQEYSHLGKLRAASLIELHCQLLHVKFQIVAETRTGPIIAVWQRGYYTRETAHSKMPYTFGDFTKTSSRSVQLERLRLTRQMACIKFCCPVVTLALSIYVWVRISGTSPGAPLWIDRC